MTGRPRHIRAYDRYDEGVMRHFKTYEAGGIRDEYARMGVDSYYSANRKGYVNPHLSGVQDCLEWAADRIDIGYFLDLACGNGEASSHLLSMGLTNFKGCDPYFSAIYEANLGRECYDMRFEDIANKGLPERFDTVVCSYALHLCPRTYWHSLLWSLSTACNHLVIVSPSKHPVVETHFEQVDGTKVGKTHCRVYSSLHYATWDFEKKTRQ